MHVLFSYVTPYHPKTIFKNVEWTIILPSSIYIIGCLSLIFFEKPFTEGTIKKIKYSF